MAGESFSLVCFDFFLFILAAEIAEEEEEDGETVRQSADQSTSLVGLHNPFVYPSGERIGNQPAVAGGAFPPVHQPRARHFHVFSQFLCAEQVKEKRAAHALILKVNVEPSMQPVSLDSDVSGTCAGRCKMNDDEDQSNSSSSPLHFRCLPSYSIQDILYASPHVGSDNSQYVDCLAECANHNAPPPSAGQFSSAVLQLDPAEGNVCPSPSLLSTLYILFLHLSSCLVLFKSLLKHSSAAVR